MRDEWCRRGRSSSISSCSTLLRDERLRRGSGRGPVVSIRREGCLARDAESDGSISSSSYGGPISSQLEEPADPEWLRLPVVDAGERTDALPPLETRDPSGCITTRCEPLANFALSGFVLAALSVSDMARGMSGEALRDGRRCRVSRHTSRPMVKCM